MKIFFIKLCRKRDELYLPKYTIPSETVGPILYNVEKKNYYIMYIIILYTCLVIFKHRFYKYIHLAMYILRNNLNKIVNSVYHRYFWIFLIALWTSYIDFNFFNLHFGRGPLIFLVLSYNCLNTNILVYMYTSKCPLICLLFYNKCPKSNESH